MENTTMSNGLRRLLIIFGALLVLSLLASGFSAVYVTLAAPQRSTYVPTTIGFEGQLADAQGVPVADGQYTITFILYDAATGGDDVWSQEMSGIQVKDGLYSVQLGPFTGAEFSGARWLAVKVGEDAEMAPRIPVGAVPFALNAKYAQGLQNYPVADTAPATNNALMWTGTTWAPQGMTFPDLAAVGSNASPNDLLKNYRSGAILRWKDASTVEVSTGELMINGFMRRNKPLAPTTSGMVDVKFTPDAGGSGPNRGLDTGTPQSGTPYYVYAVADDPESTFDLIISESPDEPATVTNFRKLGSFSTQINNTNIQLGSVANSEQLAQLVPDVRVYNSSAISVPADTWTALTFNSERWDTDNLHSTDTNTGRLTASKAGSYLLFGNIEWASSNVGIQRHIMIRLNGSITIGRQDQMSASNTITLAESVATAYYLQAGDYVEFLAYTGTGPYDIQVTGNYSPEFGMVWMGP